MPIREFTIWLAAILILAAMLGRPAGVAAQCSVTNTDTGSATQGGMTYMYVIKTLAGAYSCALTMQMGVIDCAPGYGGANTNVLSGSAFLTAMTPTCAWTCTCGTITIDGSDNLPVELMEFSVEDERAAGTAGEGGEDHRAAATDD